MPYPNFYIIGAPKCGTETLASWLSDHPEVSIRHRTADIFEACGRKDKNPDANLPSDFFEKTKTLTTGEVSPWGLYSETAVSGILKTAPETRFVVCLRNPIDMAWVLHSSFLASGQEHIEDFAAAWSMSHLRREGQEVKPGCDPQSMDYFQVCSLGEQLVHLTAIADPAQIHLVFLDDLLKRPQDAWADLQAFLEVSLWKRAEFPVEDFLVLPEPRSNRTLLRRFLDAGRSVLPRHLRSSGNAKPVNGLNRRTGRLAEMPGATREMLSEYLSDDIGVISAMSGRDLSGWIC